VIEFLICLGMDSTVYPPRAGGIESWVPWKRSRADATEEVPSLCRMQDASVLGTRLCEPEELIFIFYFYFVSLRIFRFFFPGLTTGVERGGGERIAEGEGTLDFPGARGERGGKGKGQARQRPYAG
jgi:hypothetical protein